MKSLTQEQIKALPAICIHEPTKGYFVQRYVVAAANRFGKITIVPSRQEAYEMDNPVIDLVVASARHYSPVMGFVMDEINRLREKCGEEQLPYAYGDNQGFIDQFDRYMTREEAFIVATHTNQINARRDVVIIENDLFSENLY